MKTRVGPHGEGTIQQLLRGANQQNIGSLQEDCTAGLGVILIKMSQGGDLNPVPGLIHWVRDRGDNVSG